MKDIIIVDDEKDIRTLLSTILEDEGYDTRIAANSQELFELLKGRIPNIILLDIWLKKSILDGIETLHKLALHFPDIDVIMISGHGNIKTGTHAMQVGAYSFMEKPIKAEHLLLVLERVLKAQKDKMLMQSQKIGLDYTDNNLAFLEGTSSACHHLRAEIEKQQDKDSRIIFTGEHGAGKKCVAAHIHNYSSRKNNVFIVVPTMHKIDHIVLEKILFGYSSPDYPEYVGQKSAFENAHLGTIYLENIDLYPHSVQKKLIKYLVDKKFSRFMATDKIVQTDTRVMASLSMPAEKAIANNQLLNDLYVRLAISVIEVPNLMQRQDDIKSIAMAYAVQAAKKYPKFTPKLDDSLCDYLRSYKWQYGLNELKQLMSYLVDIAVLNNEKGIISASYLPNYSGEKASPKNISDAQPLMYKSLREAREIFERDYLLAQLNRFKGNISKTAQFVGMERSALHRKLRSLNIENYRDMPLEAAVD